MIILFNDNKRMASTTKIKETNTKHNRVVKCLAIGLNIITTKLDIFNKRIQMITDQIPLS